MTNHCPEKPATVLMTRESEVRIQDFAESILEKIQEFASDEAINNGMRIHSGIVDTWPECSRCEAAVIEVQEIQECRIIHNIVKFLEANVPHLS